jgi:UDP-N-acetylmuramoyl-L-alanyl-D-glutamate--2,6-diaminopimelate ligase
VLLHDLLVGSAGEVGSSEAEVLEVRGDPAVEIGSIAHDNRQVEPGALFCCIPGATTDGHEYAAMAELAGASAFLVEHFVDVRGPQVRVRSVRAAVGPIASRLLGDPSGAMAVLGVTGTNGKTTTCYLLEAIAAAEGRRTGVIGTVETRYANISERLRHTTPEAAELQSLLARMRDAGVETVAIEVSSHALDQHRVDGTHFAATCFTNLSQDHLDYHGTLEAYIAAKARLFTPGFTSRAAFNIATPIGRTIAAGARELGLEVVTFAIDGPEPLPDSLEADVRARDIELEREGARFVLEHASAGRVLTVQLSLPGRFNVENALAAATTASLAGTDLDVIVAGLSAPLVVPGRMERIDNDRGLEVLVDYAHTPEALEQALAAARSITAPEGRVIVVFGCGGDRDRDKRPKMGAATTAADLAVLTSDNPRSEDAAAIAADVVAGVPPQSSLVVQLDRRAAIRDALAVARAGDVVLIAGKGHEQGQVSAGVTVPFDDRTVAREELEALRCA